jgi:uncharacterized membrane protein YdfJ with MMPL/SSD domain
MMPDVDAIAVVVATLAAFVLGGAYYALLGEHLAEVSEAAAADEQTPPWKLASIHAGDWLMKLPVVSVLVSVLQ